VLLTLLGVFDAGFWDVTVEYAKNSPCDILCRYTVHNESDNTASIHLLPTLWFRSALLSSSLQLNYGIHNVQRHFGCDNRCHSNMITFVMSFFIAKFAHYLAYLQI